MIWFGNIEHQNPQCAIHLLYIYISFNSFSVVNMALIQVLCAKYKWKKKKKVQKKEGKRIALTTMVFKLHCEAHDDDDDDDEQTTYFTKKIYREYYSLYAWKVHSLDLDIIESIYLN